VNADLAALLEQHSLQADNHAGTSNLYLYSQRLSGVYLPLLS
jgi:hypothetical protein